MRSISNDFVTIEYDTPEKKTVAQYCINLFNSDKKLYKGLLSGRTNINIDRLINYFKFNYAINRNGQDYINEKIMESLLKTNLKDVSVIETNFRGLYLDILITRLHPEEHKQQPYFDFAYYYYKKTGDYSYLLKYQEEQDYDMDDCIKLCNFVVSNDFEELLKAKLSFSIDEINNNQDMRRNLRAILKLLAFINKKHLQEAGRIYAMHQKRDIKGIIPRISEEDFNRLILEATEYIDPSLELTEKLLKFLRDDKLIFNYSNEKVINIFDYKSGKIVITPEGTIEDVITFMHEFGHLWYYDIENDIDNSNSIFAEFPSIYFELKAVEFLKNRGYTEDEVNAAELFRREHDIQILPYAGMTLNEILNNIGKGEEDYDVEQLMEFLAYNVSVNDIDQLDVPNDFIINACNQIRPHIKYLYLTSTPQITDPIKYLLGTYLAEHSIKNLDHEEVMDSMKTIKQEDCDFYSTFKILGLDPEEFGFIKTKETKVDKKLSLKRENPQEKKQV